MAQFAFCLHTTYEGFEISVVSPFIWSPPAIRPVKGFTIILLEKIYLMSFIRFESS